MHPVSSSTALTALSESFWLFYAVSNHAAKGRFFQSGKYQDSITDHILKTRMVLERKNHPNSIILKSWEIAGQPTGFCGIKLVHYYKDGSVYYIYF